MQRGSHNGFVDIRNDMASKKYAEKVGATTKRQFNFLAGFNKAVGEMEGISESSDPPRYFYSFGNFVLNKIMSGSFFKGLPQGRVVNLSGPSGSGKSFVAANAMKSAQQDGAFILVVDSENAMDDDFVSKVGVDTTDGYKYVGVSTVPQVTNVVSTFLKVYKKVNEEDLINAPRVLIVIDSLDMLMTETEMEHYDKGDQKGDQGQRNKQLKAMLRTFVQDIKSLNVTVLVTSQVYRNQDLKNGEGIWMIAEAVKYAASIIALLTKLKLKEKQEGPVLGIRMKCQGYKTRLTKPFQECTIEVPYETGMNKFSGLVETAVALGVVEKRGSRYGFPGDGDTWFAKDVETVSEKILLKCEMVSNPYLQVEDEEVDTETESVEETRNRRQSKKPRVAVEEAS